MKTFVEKLTLSENTSFVARTYRTPHFEVSWHQHVEYELILFTEGSGTAYIGEATSEFTVGDIFFLGSNLLHTFQKQHEYMIVSAVVVQFAGNFWGDGFMLLPEAASVQKLFHHSRLGLKIKGGLKKQLQPLIAGLEHLQGFARLVRLCECLNLLASSSSFDVVCGIDAQNFSSGDKDRIDRVFQYTSDHFKEAISLSAVASIAGLSVPAFCSYFKKCTKKTYIDFLNGVRISHACKLLRDTQDNVLDICYNSGFNTLANFNKQFLKIKGYTPSELRKQLKTIDTDLSRIRAVDFVN